MSRDEYDIPEVFRRAMEEAGWDTSCKDDDGGQQPPLPSRPEGDGRPNRLIVIAGLVLGAVLLVGWLANVYTEWLWFNSVDYQGVWLTQWAARLGIFVFFFGLALLILLLNWLIARRRALRHTPPFNPKFLQIPHMKWLITGIAAFIAFGFASSIAVYWGDLLRYLHRVPYGVADPIFSRDISFYLFELPLFTLVQQWFVSLLVITLIGVIAIYAANHVPEIQRGTWRPHESKILRQHVALLAAQKSATRAEKNARTAAQKEITSLSETARLLFGSDDATLTALGLQTQYQAVIDQVTGESSQQAVPAPQATAERISRWRQLTTNAAGLATGQQAELTAAGWGSARLTAVAALVEAYADTDTNQRDAIQNYQAASAEYQADMEALRNWYGRARQLSGRAIKDADPTNQQNLRELLGLDG